jgi:hypothetical protein
MPKYQKPKAFDIIADILQMQKDIKALQIRTNAAATGGPGNTLTLLDGAAPATPVGGTTLFSETGNLGYVSEDGNTYDTGRLTAANSSTQTVSGITLTPVAGLSVPVGAATYRFLIVIHYISVGTSGQPEFQVDAPSTSGTPAVSFTTFQTTPPPAAPSLFNYAGFGTISGAVVINGSGEKFQVRFEGIATFTIAGNIAVSAQMATGSGSVSLPMHTSYIDLMPVV